MVDIYDYLKRVIIEVNPYAIQLFHRVPCVIAQIQAVAFNYLRVVRVAFMQLSILRLLSEGSYYKIINW